MITHDQKKNRRGAYFNCITCGNEFYAFPSYIKKCNAAGVKISYCSMKCYDKTGKNNPFYGKKQSAESLQKGREHPNARRFGRPGINNPNVVRYGEEYGFKGSRFEWWRRKLLRDIGQCERCGYEDKRILTVHHIDRNHSNNAQENLTLLCWNCHMKDHADAKDGPFGGNNKRKVVIDD